MVWLSSASVSSASSSRDNLPPNSRSPLVSQRLGSKRAQPRVGSSATTLPTEGTGVPSLFDNPGLLLLIGPEKSHGENQLFASPKHLFPVVILGPRAGPWGSLCSSGTGTDHAMSPELIQNC